MPAPQLVKRVSTPTLRGSRHFIEIALPVVAIKAAGVFGEMRLEQIKMAVEVVVADAHAHAGLLHAIVAERDTAHHAFFAKRSVMVVHEQQAGRGIAGDEDVGPAVLVEIGRDHCHSITLGCARNPRLLAHVVNVPSPLLR